MCYLFTLQSDPRNLSDLFFILLIKHVRECLERFLELSWLKSTDFKKLIPNTICEALPVFWWNCCFLVKVDFVSHNYTTYFSALVFLSYALIPLLEKSKWVWIGAIIDQHDLVRFAKKVKCDLFEYVLSCNIYQVEFYWGIWLLHFHIFDVVFTTLCHHVVVIELSFEVLVDNLSFSNSRFASDNYPRSQDRHLRIRILNY